MMGQLPSRATATLRRDAYSRSKGEQVAHEVCGGNVTITFLSTTFFGGISRRTIPLADFERDFAIIGAKRVRR